MVERLRVCLVYDCLFPYTVGGAERWYRNVGERRPAEGPLRAVGAAADRAAARVRAGGARPSGAARRRLRRRPHRLLPLLQPAGGGRAAAVAALRAGGGLAR